jgi:hypothetical protein
LYDFDATLLLHVYSYLFFVGKGWLALLPSQLPNLRVLCLQFCHNLCVKYVEEMMAAVPELNVIK